MAKGKDFNEVKRWKGDKNMGTDYDRDINTAERSRSNQLRDSMPGIQYEGYLGMDDIDRLRRRKISKIF